MGLMSWLSSPRRAAARKQIQHGLQFMKSHGLFDGDPIKGAQVVEDFSAPRLSKTVPDTVMDDMNATILAATWLAVFVSTLQAPREYLLPFANAGLGLLRVATTSDLKLASWEESIAVQAFLDLQAFIDAGALSLNLNVQQPQREVVPIDGPSSMFCIVAERNYLDARYGAGNWQLVSQASIEEKGRFYDKLTITLAQGEEVVVWFDLTESKAKWTDEGNIEALRHFQQIMSKATEGDKSSAVKRAALSEKQGIGDTTPRDRDRAMTELIKRMKA